MLRTLLDKQQKSINHFFSALDIANAERVLEKLLSCSGVVILSGVGKSGHIAQKISTTLSSTGTRSLFLCPAHALHGDVGVVSPQDIFLALSKSGASQELLDLLPYVQKKGAFTIAAVSQENSLLAKMADLSVVLPVENELCPFGLAPTTSAAVQLLFGDCLAMALMQKKQFTVNDFALNHPAGFLGRKITLKVSDLMLKGKDLPLCRLEDCLIEVLHELSAKRCGCLLVCDSDFSLLGIFTDGDLRRAIEKEGREALQMPVSHFVTTSPVTIDSGVLVVDAIRRMEADPGRLVTVLPIVEKNRVVGLLRMHDVIQAGLR